MSENSEDKSPIAKREEAILNFWRENKIFEKTLKKSSPRGEFIFYEGPPTANGRPGIHHLGSRAFKDLIPRFKTMRGYHVRRKGGWDTHGLPVEIEVEKELGLKSKREIEDYGIAEFNKKCKENVWKYIREWEEFTERIAYWIDLKHPYITYKPYYIESLWNIIKNVDEKKLLYKDYKVLPWCPRCQTALSSHELAQGYQDAKDLSVFVKFKVKSEKLKVEGETYLLAWTTTPWTLPGNVALAVNKSVVYCELTTNNQQPATEKEYYILAKDRIESVFKGREYEIIEEFPGDKLIGLEYQPLYPFFSDKLKTESSQLKALENAFKVYPADFVTTEEGTGIVHTAVMYGQDDFELGTKVNLPKYHLVNEDGTFKKETGFLSGKFVKDEKTDVEIIKDLARRELLFHKEKHSHSYPHCWRCKTALIYFARDSWYIKMSALKKELIKENRKINWEPDYIKEGRFGEWLSEVKDWAISRERYWGTPLPVWQCGSCEKREVLGSFEDLFLKEQDKRLTRLILLRHGESEKNAPRAIFDSSPDTYGLTKTGRRQAEAAAAALKKLSINALYSSPVRRARETAEIISVSTGQKAVLDERLWEVRNGSWEGKAENDSALGDRIAYNELPDDQYYSTARGGTGESWQAVEKRMSEFVAEITKKHPGQTVAVVSHEGPLMFLLRFLKGLSLEEITNLWQERRDFNRGLLGGYAEPTSVFVSAATGKEIDPHCPQIDEFKLSCKCGGQMARVKEVLDVWFDSGAMPFAQDHYPFKDKEWVDKKGFPADFISEAIDQTRGWFYTLHAIGVLTGRGRAYKNVICLGLLLDKEGKKMSKSSGNVIVPKQAIDKFGVDILRFWFYSVNQPGDSKNFDQQTIDEIVKKFVNPLTNVLAFYKIYGGSDWEIKKPTAGGHILDNWILAYLSQLIRKNTELLEDYKITEAARNLKEFVSDLSQWYVRRSRENFKAEQTRPAALSVLGLVLLEFSKLLSPFMPFLSESIYQELKCRDKKESVHLEEWPKLDSRFKIPRIPKQSLVRGKQDSRIMEEMEEVRRIVSLALEQRAKAGIKIRQPLLTLRVKNHKSRIMNHESLTELIKDEVNVKEVIFTDKIAGEIELDTVITQDLKLEGQKRELIRAIQQLRKARGLRHSDWAVLKAETDRQGREFLDAIASDLKNKAWLERVVFEKVNGGTELNLAGTIFRISF